MCDGISKWIWVNLVVEVLILYTELRVDPLQRL